MEVQCLKIKLKQGTTERVVDWMKSLYGRMDEVQKALAGETMIVESVFLERGKETDYLVFYTRAESLKKANEVLMSSTNPVDREALEVMAQTRESAQPLELLFDVDRIEKVKA